MPIAKANSAPAARDALKIERCGPDTTVDGVEGGTPPGEEASEGGSERDDAEADEGQLHGQPAGAGDGLGEGELPGAVLEFAGEEGGADERTGERGKDVEPGQEIAPTDVAIGERRDDLFAGTSFGCVAHT